MDDAQKVNIPLDSEIDTKSSDMLVSVDQPKLAHNRQRWQGHTLPTSLRFEHNGWAAGEQVYEFEFEGGRVKESVQSGEIAVCEMARTRYNGNPAYILNLYKINGDDKYAKVYFNFATSASDIDIPDLQCMQPLTGDRSIAVITGTFNNRPFSFNINVLTMLTDPEHAVTYNPENDGFSCTAKLNSRGVTVVTLADNLDTITVDTRQQDAAVIFPSPLYNKEGPFLLEDITSVEKNEDGTYKIDIGTEDIVIDNVDLNSTTSLGEDVTISSADESKSNITAPVLDDSSDAGESLPINFSYERLVDYTLKYVGSIMYNLAYIRLPALGQSNVAIVNADKAIPFNKIVVQSSKYANDVPYICSDVAGKMICNCLPESILDESIAEEGESYVEDIYNKTVDFIQYMSKLYINVQIPIFFGINTLFNRKMWLYQPDDTPAGHNQRIVGNFMVNPDSNSIVYTKINVVDFDNFNFNKVYTKNVTAATDGRWVPTYKQVRKWEKQWKRVCSFWGKTYSLFTGWGWSTYTEFDKYVYDPIYTSGDVRVSLSGSLTLKIPLNNTIDGGQISNVLELHDKLPFVYNSNLPNADKTLATHIYLGSTDIVNKFSVYSPYLTTRLRLKIPATVKVGYTDKNNQSHEVDIDVNLADLFSNVINDNGFAYLYLAQFKDTFFEKHPTTGGVPSTELDRTLWYNGFILIQNNIQFELTNLSATVSGFDMLNIVESHVISITAGNLSCNILPSLLLDEAAVDGGVCFVENIENIQSNSRKQVCLMHNTYLPYCNTVILSPSKQFSSNTDNYNYLIANKFRLSGVYTPDVLMRNAVQLEDSYTSTMLFKTNNIYLLDLHDYKDYISGISVQEVLNNLKTRCIKEYKIDYNDTRLLSTLGITGCIANLKINGIGSEAIFKIRVKSVVSDTDENIINAGSTTGVTDAADTTASNIKAAINMSVTVQSGFSSFFLCVKEGKASVSTSDGTMEDIVDILVKNYSEKVLSYIPTMYLYNDPASEQAAYFIAIDDASQHSSPPFEVDGNGEYFLFKQLTNDNSTDNSSINVSVPIELQLFNTQKIDDVAYDINDDKHDNLMLTTYIPNLLSNIKNSLAYTTATFTIGAILFDYVDNMYKNIDAVLTQGLLVYAVNDFIDCINNLLFSVDTQDNFFDSKKIRYNIGALKDANIYVNSNNTEGISFKYTQKPLLNIASSLYMGNNTDVSKLDYCKFYDNACLHINEDFDSEYKYVCYPYISMKDSTWPIATFINLNGSPVTPYIGATAISMCIIKYPKSVVDLRELTVDDIDIQLMFMSDFISSDYFNNITDDVYKNLLFMLGYIDVKDDHTSAFTLFADKYYAGWCNYFLFTLFGTGWGSSNVEMAEALLKYVADTGEMPKTISIIYNNGMYADYFITIIGKFFNLFSNCIYISSDIQLTYNNTKENVPQTPDMWYSTFVYKDVQTYELTIPVSIKSINVAILDDDISNYVDIEFNNIHRNKAGIFEAVTYNFKQNILYNCTLVPARLLNSDFTEGTLKFKSWHDQIFIFEGVHTDIQGNVEEYTVEYNSITQDVILYYKGYTLPVNNIILPVLRDNDYLKDTVDVSFSRYHNKVLDYITFERGIDTIILAKLYGPFKTQYIGDGTTAGNIAVTQLQDNNLLLTYTGSPSSLQGAHTFNMAAFESEDNQKYLQVYSTDVNNKDSYLDSAKKHLGKIDAKEEYQLIKQAWNTTTAIENYWWITPDYILYLTKDAFCLKQRTDKLDDWNGDVWEDATYTDTETTEEKVVNWPRTDYLPSTVLQYGVSNVNKENDGHGARLWTLQAYSDTQFKLRIYRCIDNTNNITQPYAKMPYVEYTFTIKRVPITIEGELLNKSNNDFTLYTYSDINAINFVSEAQISCTQIGWYTLVGLHVDDNFNQWAICLRDSAPTQCNIVQGYGFVGIDGCLTGGQIPAKYFSNGFSGAVRDIKCLTAKDVKITLASELSQFNERIVGNESQQWYISKSIDSIVSHLTFDNGVWTPVKLPILNNYAYCYESPSFITRVAGDNALQAKPLLSLLPTDSSANQWIWNLLFGMLGAPILYYINPKISYLNYLQQTVGQYAYVHYNSTSIYQGKDLTVAQNLNPFDTPDNDNATAVTKDELSFDITHIAQEQTAGDTPWTQVLYLFGTALTTALDYAAEKIQVNMLQNQSATKDIGGKYSQMFIKNVESMTRSLFTVKSYTPIVQSEVTMLKTLDMFYSTSAAQKIYAGPGYVNHNFVAQCIAQSATSIECEGNRLSILALFEGLTILQIKLEVMALKKIAEYMNIAVNAVGGSPFAGFMGGTSSGSILSWGSIIAAALAIGAKAIELAALTIETAIPLVQQIVNALGGNHVTSTITDTISAHNMEIEPKHRYGSKSESFMWPCYDCTENVYVKESVEADSLSKPWKVSLNPTGSLSVGGIVSQRTLNKYVNGIGSLIDSDSRPSSATIAPNQNVKNLVTGDVEYRIAGCRGKAEDTMLPDGMACVIGTDTFLPTETFKNQNIGESEPVFPTPLVQDYILAEPWKLSMTCIGPDILWVSCKDTKLIDGKPSNVIFTDDFCGVAAPYTAIEVQREMSQEYLRPWAVTPNVLALNVTGLNTVFDKKLYHGFDGYGYRIINWYGSSGMNKEHYAMMYQFQINDRFKRSNKLPPNQFLGNFKSLPSVSLQTIDRIYSQVAMPSENTGMDSGVAGEDRDAFRYSLPIFSEFVSTLPAIVKTLSSNKLLVYDGVTSLCTDIRSTRSAYKTSISTDFNIGTKQFRITNDYICSVDTQAGTEILQELVPTLGLTYLGATLTEAYFYSPATRKYYGYTGGANLYAIDMLERFRDIKNGVWDFVDHVVVMPCLATFDRLDKEVKDDADETDNIFVPVIQNNKFTGEVTPPDTTLFNTDSWFRVLSLPSGITYQGPNRCAIHRFVFMDYMKDGIKHNQGKWQKVPREVYHPFRKYREQYKEITNFINDGENPVGWTHNQFLFVTSPLGVNEETDCMYEWEITFAWTVEMDKLYAQNEYVCVNVIAETMSTGGKVVNRPTHIYLTKELFTRTSNYGYYSFRYESNNGIGNRERLHIWSDGYIAISSVQLEYKPMTTKRQTKLTQAVDIQHYKEF